MRIVYTAFFLSMILPAVTYAGEPVDRIVAVVGETPILESALLEELAVYTGESSLQQIPEEELRQMALKKLIDNQILLTKAEQDDLLPNRDEVEDALDRSLDRMRGQFSSEEEFRSALAQENLTLEELRKRYRSEVEKSLTIRMMVDREIRWKSEVTEAESRRFYEEHVDELPELPERCAIAQIFLRPRADKAAGAALTAELEELKDRVLAGEDFGELAAVHSDGPSASVGGDLGFFGAGDMDSTFAAAAFALVDPGDVSGVVPTRFGYHLIQLTDRDGKRIRARHILKTIPPGSESWAATRAAAESLLDSLRSGVDFGRIASTHSDDAETASRRGKLGVYSFDDMTDPMRAALSNLEEGGMSDIVESPEGIHIFRVEKRYERGKPTFEEARTEVQRVVRQEKQQKLYDEYLDNLRREIFVEITATR